MKMFKKPIFIIYLVIITMIALGCWDNKDVNDKSFVSAIGIDKGEEEPIEISLQILRPNFIKAYQMGATDECPFIISSTTGDTIFEAVREQLKTINRKPFYAHLKLIIIGEEMAKRGISDILDFFLRNHETKITPKILIVKDHKAKDLIGVRSEIDNIPAVRLEGILENNTAQATTREVNLIDVVQELSAVHGSVVIPTMIAEDKENLKNSKDLKIEGSAVLHKDQLIGYLDTGQTRGYLFIKNEVDGGIINIDNPKEKDRKVAIEILHAKGSMGVSIEGEDLILKIKVKLRGALAEEHGSADLANEEILDELEKRVEKSIEETIKNVLEIGQKTYKRDFFGFGNKVYGKYPHYWKEVKDQWDEEFSKLPVHISIDVDVDSTGTFSKPITTQ